MNWPLYTSGTSVKGLTSTELIVTSAKINSFQEVMNCQMITTATAGQLTGIMIFQ